MFTKNESELEMLVVVCWSYSKWYILIVKSTVPLVDHFLIKVWFGLVLFYAISTIVGYLMPNTLYTYILNIYDLV